MVLKSTRFDYEFFFFFNFFYRKSNNEHIINNEDIINNEHIVNNEHIIKHYLQSKSTERANRSAKILEGIDTTLAKFM